MSKNTINIWGVLFIFILFPSCKRTNNDLYTIDASKAKDLSELINDNTFLDLESSFVQVPSEVPLGNIYDVAFVDSLVFILDSNKNIFSIDICKGVIISHQRSFGRAKLEMIEPISLSADKHNVYVYDSVKRCFFVLNHDLNINTSKPISTNIDYFRKTNDGFLCVSLMNRQMAYYFNEDGIIQHSYELSNIDSDIRNPTSVFQTGANGTIYLKAMFGNTIYAFEKNELKPIYNIDYGKYSIPSETTSSYNILNSDYKYSLDFFIIGKDILHSFYDPNNHILTYNIQIYNSNKNYSGTIGKCGGIPFIPKWQFEKHLLNIKTYDEISQIKINGIKNIPNSFIIFKYSFP